MREICLLDYLSICYCELTQLVITMHNLCKVQDSNPEYQQKKLFVHINWLMR